MPRESKQAVRRAVTAFYKHLPLEAMSCDVLPHTIALVYDGELNAKLSYEVAYVLAQQGHPISDDVTYRPMHYSPATRTRNGNARSRRRKADRHEGTCQGDQSSVAQRKCVVRWRGHFRGGHGRVGLMDDPTKMNKWRDVESMPRTMRSSRPSTRRGLSICMRV